LRHVKHETETYPRDLSPTPRPLPAANKPNATRTPSARGSCCSRRTANRRIPGHAGEEKAPVKAPVMKVVVMEAGEVREGVAGECGPGKDMRRKHVAAEPVARKSVATKAGAAAEAAKSAMPASAATTAMTAPAAMRDGAGRP